MSPIKINKEEAAKLWLGGLPDAEIAKHFNCSRDNVCKWRMKNGLPSNYTITRSKESLVNHDQITKLWFNGLKDSEIAKELKCSVVTVWMYREKNGMGSNVGIFRRDGATESHGKVEGKIDEQRN